MFIQMEDEIAAMAAVVGASMGGVKALTATSGPGFSLKQENLGYAAGAEIPCVIVNVMRGGPSTGMPTRPSQADIMQTPLRQPRRLSDHRADAGLGARDLRRDHPRLRSRRDLPHPGDPAVRSGDRAVVGDRGARRHAEAAHADTQMGERSARGLQAVRHRRSIGIPAMARPGDGYRTHTTGLTHSESGFPTQDPGNGQPQSRPAVRQARAHRDLIDSWEALQLRGRRRGDRRDRHQRPRRAPRRRYLPRRRRPTSGCSARSRCGRSRKPRCARRPRTPAPCWCPNSISASSGSRSSGCSAATQVEGLHLIQRRADHAGADRRARHQARIGGLNVHRRRRISTSAIISARR